ncbi:MAG: hypothetical protein JWN44_4959 [Myxococcales bacterium]|nr:hypothetical protein [Myxococcales bacterium]
MVRSRTFVGVTLLVLSALSGVAQAEIQQGVPEVYPSKHEISTHMGFQAGFGGKFGSTSGFKLDADYAYRFHQFVWFDAAIANVFGFGSADGFCNNGVGGASCYRGGWALELMAGVKFKFLMTRIPLVIEAPALIGVEVLYNRDCGDNGAGVPVVRTGAGVKYFLTKRIGVGAKFDVAFGPGFHGSGTILCSNKSYTDFYGYFDFLIGAEFVL